MPDQDLEARIKQAKEKLEPVDSSTKNESSLGGRLIIDLIAGIIVGGFLGYALDKQLDTTPLFLLIMIILGACGGLYSFYKELNRR